MAKTKIKSGGITADAVETAAIKDLNVTVAKLPAAVDISTKTVTLPASVAGLGTGITAGQLTSTLDISSKTLTLPASVAGLATGITNAQLAGSIDVTSKITGTVPTTNLGSGTASSATVLYGDQTYKAEPGGSRTLLQTNTITSNTAVTSFDSTVLTSSYDLYEIHIIEMFPETDSVDVQFYISSDNGSSYITGAIDQMSTRNRPGDTSGVWGVTSQDYVKIGSDLENVAGSTMCGVIRLWNFAASDRAKMITFHIAHVVSVADQVRNMVGSAMYEVTTALNNVKIQMESNNISAAVLKLYGVT